MIAERNSRNLWAIPLLVTICLGSIPARAQYGGGSGKIYDPYQVWTAEQMNAIGAEPNDWDKHFKLMADIDLADYTEGEFKIIGHWGRFTGTFDGNGKKIVNFVYEVRVYDGDVGLFGRLGERACIENLVIVNPRVEVRAAHYAGILAGIVCEGTITNCRVEGGSITGGYHVGGLVGFNGTSPSFGGTISGCQSSARVSGEFAVGGLVGVNYHLITLSSSSGDVQGDARTGGLIGVEGMGSITQSCSTSRVSGQTSIGGLVGYNAGGVISESYADGPVSGNSVVGSLVGSNIEYGPPEHGPWAGEIRACYATGDATGNEQVGGLVGFSGDVTEISECYSTGRVSARTSAGGLIGLSFGQVDGCFWDVETSGRFTSAAGIGKSTVEMQMRRTFVDWYGPCVAATWTIDEGNDYPRLLWENRQGETLAIGLSDFLAGEGTKEDPYMVRTAEDMNAISLVPCERDKHFRLAFLDGDGTEQSPYLIDTADDLDLLGMFPYELDVQFKLVTDIDMRACTGQPFHSMRRFAGVFDGNRKAISNFTCALASEDDVGLFGHVAGDHACIRDLGLVDPNVAGGVCVGSLVGYAEDVTIENCYVKGGRVKGRESVGGLVGKNQGTLSGCYSAGTANGDTKVGGLAGSNTGIIRHCYATRDVVGDAGIGGLVGTNTASCETIDYGAMGHEYVCHIGYIYHCYSAGPVTGNTDVGGLVGDSESMVIGSFWDTDTSGHKGGFGGTGIVTARMQTAKTFLDAGWDLVGETANGTEEIWSIREGRDYPRLWWEGMEE